MEFDKSLIYLTPSEQRRTGLPSPIHFDELDVVVRLRTATQRYEEASEAVNADHNEGLPHERANAVKNMSVFGAQKEVFSEIASELVLRGVLDMAEVEAIH